MPGKGGPVTGIDGLCVAIYMCWMHSGKRAFWATLLCCCGNTAAYQMP